MFFYNNSSANNNSTTAAFLRSAHFSCCMRHGEGDLRFQSGRRRGDGHSLLLLPSLYSLGTARARAAIAFCCRMHEKTPTWDEEEKKVFNGANRKRVKNEKAHAAQRPGGQKAERTRLSSATLPFFSLGPLAEKVQRIKGEEIGGRRKGACFSGDLLSSFSSIFGWCVNLFFAPPPRSFQAFQVLAALRHRALSPFPLDCLP